MSFLAKEIFMRPMFFQSVILSVVLPFILASCFFEGDRARQDLMFMRDEMTRNHPGIGNAQDLKFGHRLHQSYKKHEKELDRAWTDHDRWGVLQNFAQSFDDHHVFLEALDPKLSSSHKNQINDDPSSIPIFRMSSDRVFDWIELPTFSISREGMKSFKSLLQHISDLSNHPEKIIVFDLRGNKGGSSFYAQNVLEALWGTQYVRSKMYEYNKMIYVDWRASHGNQKAVLKSYRELKKRNSDPELLAWAKKVSDGLNQAVREGRPYYTEREIQLSEALHGQSIEPKTLENQIAVVMDHQCASSCLDFLDMLHHLSPHKLLKYGEKTAASRLYTDVRAVVLPSGLGTFWFPMKVFRNHPRGDKQGYTPDVYMTSESVKLTSKVKEKILTRQNDEN